MKTQNRNTKNCLFFGLVLFCITGSLDSIIAQEIRMFAFSSGGAHTPTTYPQYIDEFVILDSSRVVIQYSLDFIANPNKPFNVDSDIVLLEIGSNISKSYSYGLFKHDSIATANKDRDTRELRIPVPSIEVLKNAQVGKNTIVHRTPLEGPIFMYEDEINIEWTLLPERKQLMGFTCQKAIAAFRGRIWVAWFTSEIPIYDGPWKFRGLPGLILEVSDDRSHYTFTCIGLRQVKIPIKEWKWRYEKSSREKVNNYLIRCHENPYDCARNNGIYIMVYEGSTEEAKRITLIYNPLELE